MADDRAEPRRRIGQRRVDALMRLYRDLEAEWTHAIDDVRTCRDGCGADDDIDAIADMLTMRMDQIADHRQQVGAALERLAAGTFGKCSDCGQRIPAARLEANPAAIRCIACQKRAEWMEDE